MVVTSFFTSSTVVHKHFAERNEMQTYDYVRGAGQKNFPQVNWHVLFYCTNEVCYTKY